MLTRRTLLAAGTLGLAGLAAPIDLLGASRDYRGPNVIIVRFGGGVRRRETIDPDNTFSPWLIKQLAPRGTLFRNMLLDDAEQVETSHGQGTIYLLTGRYDPLVNLSDRLLGEHFEPPSPTVFEYFRRQFQVPSHETLIINGENRASEEFYTFSNHLEYGVDYRSEVLSLFRFKAFDLRRQLAEDGFVDDQTRRQAQRELARMSRIDTRRSEHDGQGPNLDRFWQNWTDHYGHSGLVNARGDSLLTELAREAMARLKPKLMLLNFQDPDYVHWGHGAHYSRAISVIDRSLRDLVAAADADEFYRGNTCFVVVPDCGRDDNRMMRLPYQHHFNSRSAHEIWALLVGPGISRGTIVDREVQQVDVPATVAALMGFAGPGMIGEPLREAFA